MNFHLDAREHSLMMKTAIGFTLTLVIFFLALVPSKAENRLVKITVLGDSLTAGYGLEPGQSFPEKLQKAMVEKGFSVEITNAGISGDTSTGGLSRLDWSVGQDADAVIIELGANDALRGIRPDVTRKNIETMIERLKARDVIVLLAGMQAPPNMGKAYGERFNAIYPELSEKHEAMLYPFFLDGVAANKELNLSDGIHPNERGIEIMVERFLPFAEKLIEAVVKKDQ